MAGTGQRAVPGRRGRPRGGAAMLGVVAAVAVLGAVLWWSRDDPSDGLRAMAADPIARFVPPRARTVDARDTDAHTSLGIPSSAEVKRTYEVDERDAAAAFAATVRAAEQGGWTLDGKPRRSVDGLGDNTLVQGAKPYVDDLNGSVAITLSDRDGGQPVARGKRVIRVQIEAR